LLNGTEDIEEHYTNLYGKKKVYNINKVNLTTIHKLAPFLAPIYIKKDILRVVEDVDPNIIYSNNTLEGLWAKKVIECTSIKSIVHVHDMLSDISHPVTRTIMPQAIKKYDKVIAVSQACNNELEDRGISGKIVHNGIKEEYVRENEDIEKPLTIGFVGSITKRKGLDIMLEALSGLNNANIGEIIIVYNQYEKDYYMSAISEITSIEQKIVIEKNLSGQEMEAIYKSLDVLVVPSRRYPLPTTVIEGMAKGLLVLGSQVDGIPEMINNNDLLFEPNNVSSLRKKLEYIADMENEDIKKSASKLKSRAKKKFPHYKKVEKVNQIIKNVYQN